MKKFFNWVLAAILTIICDANALTSCTNDRSAKGRSQGENPAVVTEVRGTWEVNDGILQHQGMARQ